MTTTHRLLSLAVAALGLASCQSPENNADPYASNSMDGGYNPYPGQSGYVSNAAPSYTPPPTYQTPVPEPPPPPEPVAYTPPEPPKTASSSSTSASKKKTTASTSTKKKSSGSSKRHTVKSGDTLYGIAKKNGTTVAKLKSANGLSGDLIRPGQSLKVP